MSTCEATCIAWTLPCGNNGTIRRGVGGIYHTLVKGVFRVKCPCVCVFFVSGVGCAGDTCRGVWGLEFCSLQHAGFCAFTVGKKVLLHAWGGSGVGD